MPFELTDRVTPETTAQRPRRMFRHEDALDLLPAPRPLMEVESADLADVRLCRVRSTGHAIRLREPENATVLMPRRGRLMVEIGDGRFAVRPGETLVLGPNARRTVVLPDDAERHEGDVLLLSARRLDVDAEAPDGGRVRDVARLFDGPPAGRDDALLRGLFGLATARARVAGTARAADRPSRAAVALLVETLADLVRARDADSPGPRGPAARKLVRDAEEIMRAELDAPLSVAEIAFRVGVTPRRLQQAFRSVRDATPRARLGAFRLEEALRRLAEGEAARVTDVAYECGFVHLSRFAAAYAARFGETPSETLRRARG